MQKKRICKTIDISVQEAFDLTIGEYVVADTIFHLTVSSFLKEKSGWCEETREEIADFAGLTKRAIITITESLLVKGLIERNEEKKLRITQKWHKHICNQVYLGEASSPKIKKRAVKRVHQEREKDLTNSPDENVCHPVQRDPVNSMFSYFYTINPLIKFGNIAMRKAALEVIDTFGSERALLLARAAVKYHACAYAPVIVNPMQLREKSGALLAFLKKEKGKKKEKKVYIA
jgi:hypothetical protein